MSFPSSPSNTQTAIVNGITYIYSSTNNAWRRVAEVVTGVLTDTVASWDVVNTLAGVANPVEIFFKPDGLKMFLSTATTLNQYTLSTAWDITTAGAVSSFTNTWDAASTGMFFTSDGTKLITCGTNAIVNSGLGIVAGEDRAYYLTLSTPWDITTPTLVSSVRFAIGDANPVGPSGIPAAMTSPQSVYFDSTGTIMYIQDATTDYVNQFSLSTAYDVSTAQWIKRFNVAPVESGGTGLSFNIAGTRMYLVGSTGDIVAEYRLSTAWDVATAVYYDELYVGYSDVTPNGIYLDETSGNAYVVGSSSDLVTRFNTNSAGILIAPASANGRIDLVGETRIKNASLQVNENLLVDGTTNLIGSLTGAAATLSGTLTGAAATLSGSFTLSAATGTTSLNAGQTTGTIVIGGTAATGLITLGQSTAAQTLNIASGATATATTKTVNIGISGLSGSTTNINIGSAVSGSTSTVAVNGKLAIAGAATGRLTVVSTTSTASSIAAWSAAYSVFGPNAGSTSGAALALGYNTTSDRAEIVSVAPGVAWKGMDILSTGVKFISNGGSEAVRIESYDGSVGNISMALRLSTNVGTADGMIVAMGLGVQNDGFSKGGIGWVRGTVGSDTGSLTFYNNGTNDSSNFGTAHEAMRIDIDKNLLVGTTTSVSAAKVVVSSTTQGFLPPVMTTTQKNAIGSPTAGLIVFDVTLAKLCVYSGSAWQTITSV